MRDCREHRSQEIHQHRLFSLNQLSEKTTMPTGFVPDFPLKRRPPEPQKNLFVYLHGGFILPWIIGDCGRKWLLWGLSQPLTTGCSRGFYFVAHLCPKKCPPEPWPHFEAFTTAALEHLHLPNQDAALVAKCLVEAHFCAWILQLLVLSYLVKRSLGSSRTGLPEGWTQFPSRDGKNGCHILQAPA